MKYILIELFSDMPSNDFSDSKMAGEYVKINTLKGIQLIDILIRECVEFTVYELGNCIVDRSYEYWEDYSEYTIPKNKEEIEGTLK